MAYEDKNFRKLVELSHSDNAEVREKVGNWLISIGLQDVDGLRVSPYLLDLAVRNTNGELSSEDVARMLNEHYASFARISTHVLMPKESSKPTSNLEKRETVNHFRKRKKTCKGNRLNASAHVNHIS